jgi:hypothetical protein
MCHCSSGLFDQGIHASLDCFPGTRVVRRSPGKEFASRQLQNTPKVANHSDIRGIPVVLNPSIASGEGFAHLRSSVCGCVVADDYFDC